MRTISKAEYARDAERFEELLRELGRVRSLRDPISGALEEQHFSHTQIHALMWLHSDGPLAMNTLARRLAISDKTLTGVIDRLQRDGLLHRVRDEKDRRSYRIELTAKGKGISGPLHAEVRKRLTGLMELLDVSDRQALFRILEKITQRLKDRLKDMKGTGT